jgi:hypothetical protein
LEKPLINSKDFISGILKFENDEWIFSDDIYKTLDHFDNKINEQQNFLDTFNILNDSSFLENIEILNNTDLENFVTYTYLNENHNYDNDIATINTKISNNENDINSINNKLQYIIFDINDNFIITKNIYVNEIDTNTINADSIIVSNLNVLGNTTIIETNLYRTENIEIINTQNDGPSLKVTQNSSLNIAEFKNNNSEIIFNNKGYIGINKQPTKELDINGDINFNGKINNISTSELNCLLNTTQNINQHFENTSNYVYYINLALTTLIQNNDENVSNYVQNTNTSLTSLIQNNHEKCF